MKKLLIITILLFGFALAGCFPEDDNNEIDCSVQPDHEDCSDPITPTECDEGYILVEDECVAGIEEHVNPTFLDYISSDMENMNPHNRDSYDVGLMLDLITDSLYKPDYDWAKAIEMGLATEIGDFDTSGAASLPYGYFPAMADGEPIDVNGDGLVWEISLRSDLLFEDDSSIDVDTFEYSWKQLLNPNLSNLNAYYLFDEDRLPLVNAEEYYHQNEDGQSAVNWSEVGFTKIDNYTFQVALTVPKTVWEVTQALVHPSTGVIHPVNYQAGMNEDGTKTTYGTIDNPHVSYGPYTLEQWIVDDHLYFMRNEDHYLADDMRIKNIRYEIINNNSTAVEEFIAGRLDHVRGSDRYYYELIESGNIALSMNTTLFRLVFNSNGIDGQNANPLLQDINFRKAVYHAIDREEYTTSVRTPTYPTQGFLGPAYVSTPNNTIAYRNTTIGKSVLENVYPDTYGYNKTEAKRLFDLAYQNMVSDGLINDGDVVRLEYKLYDIETGYQPENWFKTILEETFNEGEVSPIFELEIVEVSAQALELAIEVGDFDMVYSGWQGLQENAASMLGLVYNSNEEYMVEQGFDTANIMVQVDLPYTKLAVQSWINEYEALSTTTIEQDEVYNTWVDMIALFDSDDTLECTYDELYNFVSIGLDNHYENKEQEFDKITASLETVLLDQMIAIPLFTTVSYEVYSSRVIFDANEYNVFMGYGGFKYIDMQKP